MGNEKLQSWALAAEIVGGIAVVATLLLLVFETRSNTYSIQAQTYQSLIEELNEIRRSMVEADIMLLEKRLSEEGAEGLDTYERRRLFSISAGAWSVYESAYFANQKSALGESEWQRFRVAICRRLETADGWRWENYGSLRITVSLEFAKFVEESCDWQSIKSELEKDNGASDT